MISQTLCPILFEFISRKFFNTSSKWTKIISKCVIFFISWFYLILFHRTGWYSSFNSQTSTYNTIFLVFKSTTISTIFSITLSSKYSYSIFSAPYTNSPIYFWISYFSLTSQSTIYNISKSIFRFSSPVFGITFCSKYSSNWSTIQSISKVISLFS